MQTLDNLKEAVEKFEEVRWYAQDKIERLGDYDHAFNFDVAMKFDGKYYASGESGIVTYIPINSEYYLSLNAKVITLHRFGDPNLKFLPDADHCQWDDKEYWWQDVLKSEEFVYPTIEKEESGDGFFATMGAYWSIIVGIISLLGMIWYIYHIQNINAMMAMVFMIWYFGFLLERKKGV